MNRRCNIGLVLSVLLFTAFLQACQTKSITEMTYDEQMQLAAALKRQCLGYGLKTGTPEFERCFVQAVRVEEEQRFRAREGWRDYVNHQRRLELARTR